MRPFAASLAKGRSGIAHFRFKAGKQRRDYRDVPAVRPERFDGVPDNEPRFTENP